MSAPPTASATPHLPVNPAARQEVFRRGLDAFFGGAPAPAPTALGPSPAAAPSASALASSPSPAAAGEGRGEGMSAPPTASASPSALPLATLPVFAGAAPGRRFAQLHDSYIIEEIEDGFLIIDQHALHERMLYEDFRARLAAGRIARQRLLLPAVIDLTPTQTESLEGCGAALAAIGFEIEPFGKQQIALQAVPDFLGKHDAGRVLGEFLDAFAEEERPRTPAELLDASLEMMACKAAVKAGDRLSEPELRHLLALRARYEHTLTCPHGRPTTLKLSLSDLEKHFHRT
ncbi:MAG: hypothetical protein HZA54_20475 [Planctomycetes bacterium]|nr:hypothetical protein [Planctomycetota bacterium]